MKDFVTAYGDMLAVVALALSLFAVMALVELVRAIRRPAASRIESPDVIRALHFALAAIDLQTETRSQDGNLPANAGKPWREEDDKLLAENFYAGQSVTEISAVFQRTRGSIASRLVKLGKVPDRYSAFHAGAHAAQPTEAVATGLAELASQGGIGLGG